MRGLSLLLLAGLTAGATGCRRAADSPAPIGPGARALLAAGQELGVAGAGDAEAGARELQAIAARVRQQLRDDPALSPAGALNKVIFDQLGYAREVDVTDLQFVLLPSVLRHHRGSCVGLGSLYLALGETLNLPIDGVMVPGHFYVRVAEGTRRRNVELLRRGEEMPDAWYRQRYPGAGAVPPDQTYGRVLTPEEVLGVIAYNVGQEQRRLTRLKEARRSYQAAVRHFPDFAEAHASLGAVFHLLGDLPAAATAYDQAHRANPQLPGLQQNRRILDAELRR